ncbi:hypothetical protein MBAV_002225 [Candidatus Magnetobacterium bavaricum]|uniref:Uncharacterized protein n=1 Tax=Candidatus Magnetobacterium bavaricum TaxID=29290 RepID=A0A0F3GUQ7_9BACT|nr:hypothetical protein MBAV_002225 [Candidatus Magnetobacterium bavaricum]
MQLSRCNEMLITNHCPYDKLRGRHNSLLYGTLVGYPNYGIIVLFRKTTRHVYVYGELGHIRFSTGVIGILMALSQRNAFGGDAIFLAEAQYIYAGTRPNRSQEILKRLRGATIPTIFYRLVSRYRHALDFSVYTFSTGKRNLNVHFYPACSLCLYTPQIWRSLVCPVYQDR